MHFTEAQIDSAIRKAAEKLGYSQLHPQQEREVKRFVEGHDMFVSLPTGSSKSLCILPATYDFLSGADSLSIVVVVSPLISLMKDQVCAMNERYMRAVFVGNCAEEEAVVDVCDGKFQLVYMSPEALLRSEKWRDMLLSPLYGEHLVGLVVDEAHCVKKW